ncbi:hypothetical protein JA1_004102 [Spathaspora sp. JA1]|nr:hypothetical protein JA1_004102 [Spathaspora sp. JA1]
MITLISNSVHDWLSAYIIKVTPDHKLDQDIDNFLNVTVSAPLALVIIVPTDPSFDAQLFNYFQLKILQSDKDIILSYMNKSLEYQTKLLDTLVKSVAKMDLSTEFNLTKEKLTFLMLNLPQFVDGLQGDVDDMVTEFEEYVAKFNSIREIVANTTK